MAGLAFASLRYDAVASIAALQKVTFSSQLLCNDGIVVYFVWGLAFVLYNAI